MRLPNIPGKKLHQRIGALEDNPSHGLPLALWARILAYFSDEYHERPLPPAAKFVDRRHRLLVYQRRVKEGYQVFAAGDAWLDPVEALTDLHAAIPARHRGFLKEDQRISRWAERPARYVLDDPSFFEE